MRGGRGMTDAAEPRSIERAEVEALLARVLAERLGDGDLPLLAAILGSWLSLSSALEERDTTIARLRKIAFGPSADRRASAEVSPAAVEDGSAAAGAQAPPDVAATDPE